MADDTIGDDELELELRPAAELASRLLILAALLDRLALETAAGGEADDAQAAAFDLREWLKAEAILPAATAREHFILHAVVGTLEEQSILNAPLLAEALVSLAWSLQLGDLPAFGSPADLAAIVATLPLPWESTRTWLNAQDVRGLDEIAVAREAAEVWEWRLTAEATRRYMGTAELAELELAIRETEADALAHSLLSPGETGGFTIMGRSIAQFARDEIDDLREQAAARLQSFNWICGYGDDWDSVPLEI